MASGIPEKVVITTDSYGRVRRVEIDGQSVHGIRAWSCQGAPREIGTVTLEIVAKQILVQTEDKA
jgi:hypothetical protein